MRRPSTRDLPPPLELACLGVLWRIGEGSVKQVRAELSTPFAYTTILTILERLVRRGAASRRKVSRAFFYAPALTLEEARRRAVRDLLETFFSGSAEALQDYLAGKPKPGPSAGRVEDQAIDTTLL